ncbi:MAG: hypothetical protein ACI89L_002142 [Phycisphaerales bacterium]|jgi:hypothetical protein
MLIDSGSRPVDVDVWQGSPTTWSGAMVEKDGAYQGVHYMHMISTEETIRDLLDSVGGSLIDIDPHYYEGEFRYAFVLEQDQTAPGDAGWELAQTTNQVASFISNNPDKIVLDIEPYDLNGTARQSMTCRDATPEEQAKERRYYPMMTRAQILDKIVNENLRLVDIDTRPHDNYFAATMELDDNVTDWWVHDATKAELDAFINQYGARVVDLEAYGDENNPTYDALLRPNVNEVIHETNMLMRNLTDGESCLKYSGWDNDGAIQADEWFNPAQAFNFYYFFAAYEELKFQPEGLDAPIAVRGGDGSDCPSDSGSLFFQPYRTVLSNMMYAQDVQATHAVYEQAGYNGIMGALADHGANDTYLINEIGCFDEAAWNPTTLDDAAKIMRFFMSATGNSQLAQSMLNILDTDLSTPLAGTLSFQSILDIALDSSSLSTWDKNKFQQHIKLFSVDGTYSGYSDPSRGTNTTRWSSFYLPHKFEEDFFNGDNTGLVAYNASAFVNQGSSLWNSETAVGLAIGNMYKEAIHEAIGTWELYSTACPADINNDGLLDNGDIGIFIELFHSGCES